MPLGLAQTLNPLDVFSPSAEKHAARPMGIYTRLPDTGEFLIATRIGPPGLAQPEFRSVGNREPSTWTAPSGYVEVDPRAFSALILPPVWYRTGAGLALIGAGAVMAVLVTPLLFDY